MSNEPSHRDLPAIRWRPVAVVNLDKERPEPVGPLTAALCEIGGCVVLVGATYAGPRAAVWIACCGALACLALRILSRLWWRRREKTR